MQASSEFPNVRRGQGYAAGHLDDLGAGPGFRKVRRGLEVTAFQTRKLCNGEVTLVRVGVRRSVGERLERGEAIFKARAKCVRLRSGCRSDDRQERQCMVELKGSGLDVESRRP